MPNIQDIVKDGDEGFIGVNMRIAPQNLPKGMVSDAVNMRFDNGIARPRHGFKKVGWANQHNTEITSHSTGGKHIGHKPFTNIKGVGKFRDPNGVKWILVATASGNAGAHTLYGLTPGNDIQTLNTNLTFDENRVEFVQCFNVVVMFRGPNLEPLKMERVENGFISISQEDTDTTIEENESRTIVDDGTDKIPNSKGGAIFFQNRLLIPYAPDSGANVDFVAVSDALNFTRYMPLLNSMRINQGDESELVALHKFDQTTILCFKESAVFAVRNIYSDLSDTYLDLLSDSFGACSARAVVSVGKDVWFLSDQRGVVSIQVHESGKLQGLDVPASDAIDPLIKRINFSVSKDFVGAYINNKIYFAVAIDNALKPNALLVFDFKNKSWAGYDQSEVFAKEGSCSVAGFTSKNTCELAANSGGGGGSWTDEVGIFDLITFKVDGAERLFLVTTEGYIGVYDDPNMCDHYDEGTVTSTTSGRNSTYDNIKTEITTRGYSFGSSDFKKYIQSNVQISTNNVVGTNKGIDIDAIFDGVQETQSISNNLTFKREKYHKPFNKPDYPVNNSNGENLVANRQDYSMSVDTEFDPKDGFDPDKKQDSLQKKRFNKRGSYMQMKIANDTGICDVKATEVHGMPDRNQQVTTRR